MWHDFRSKSALLARFRSKRAKNEKCDSALCAKFLSTRCYIMGDHWSETPWPKPKPAKVQKRSTNHFWRKVKAWCGCCVGCFKRSVKQIQTHRDRDETNKTKNTQCQRKPVAQQGLPFAKLRSAFSQMRRPPLFKNTKAFPQQRTCSAHLCVFSATKHNLCGNRNLVEQKSVLDCRRISRNFSQTRGQQKRPKTNYLRCEA